MIKKKPWMWIKLTLNYPLKSDENVLRLCPIVQFNVFTQTLKGRYHVTQGIFFNSSGFLLLDRLRHCVQRWTDQFWFFLISWLSKHTIHFLAYHSSKVSSRADCIFKFTSCDNQALLGYIPIAAVAVYFNQKS